MRRALGAVIDHPRVVLLALGALALLGVYAAFHLPVDLFPNLDVPVVNVITHDPGAAPEDVELLVTRPIEGEMRAIPGVERVASTSAQGLSQVTVQLAWGTSVADARQLVQAGLAHVQGTLPAGVSPRLETLGTTLQEVSGYVLYGAADPVALASVARHDLVARLKGVEGVSTIQVLGGDRRAFWVDLRPDLLARLHLSVADVADLLDRHNTGAVAGFLDRGGRQYLVRGDARIAGLGDLAAVPLVAAADRSVLLGSVADLSEGRAPRHYAVRGDGRPAVALIVRKEPGASPARVVAGVDRALAGLTGRTDGGGLLPPGTQVEKFYDQSEILAESQHEILVDLVLGAVLAVVVLYLFLGALRPTLVVAGTIPLTLLATVLAMRLAGLGFDTVTLTALALAIGMLVDDAIVVAETIDRHGATAADPREAAIAGAAEIAGPDASGTLTTVAAFLPLVFVTGIAGLFLRPFGITLGAALLVSLVLSLTLVPLLLGRGGAGRPARDRPPDDFLGARLLARLDRVLQRALAFCFRHRWVVAGAALALVGLAALAATATGVSVLPPIDEGALLIEYVMPPGTSLAESDRVGRILDRVALAEPDVTTVYRRTGSPETGAQIEGVNKGELLIKLAPHGERKRSAAALTDNLRRAFSRLDGVVFLYHQPTQEKIDESFSGLPALFGVTVYGEDLGKLTELAGRVQTILEHDPAVANVVNNTKVRAGEVDVRLDRAALARHGARPDEVLAALRAARAGLEATTVVRQRESVGVWLRLPAGGGGEVGPQDGGEVDPESLARLPVPLSRGALVPLGRLARIAVRPAPAEITRLNGEREITLVAEVEGSIPALVRRLRGRFEGLHLPAGYTVDFSGQYPVLIQTGEEMAGVLAGALALIYFILAVQLGSWLQPLAVLATVPLALAGALVALAATGRALDLSVGMGAVTLAGVAVNNAIVLVDFGNRRRAAGLGRRAALAEAASVRLRPILLTTATTVAALLPAAVGTTAGSPVFQPFAITVIGGLLAALGASLLLVPTLVGWRAGAPEAEPPRPGAQG